MRDESRIRVLIAEDEAHLGTLLENYLTGRGFQVTTRRDGRAALTALRAEAYDVALLDIVMPEMDGLEVLRQVREEASPPEVIIITGNGTIETAITAMKLGAYDYMSKPYRMAEIDVLVRRAWGKRQLSRENKLLHSRLLRVDAVAAIAENLLESELFGHEKGAFTGATSRKMGLFELAAGGTLFMDEIGELDTRLQGKLLRALELGSFFRVGGTQKVETDLRIIAATNQDLQAKVQQGTFRGDLYYRINTISITLPPLRERAIDIPMLAEHFLKAYGGSTPPRLSEDALVALQAYSWPGNIRELRNVIERAVLLATSGTIRASDLPVLNAPS